VLNAVWRACEPDCGRVFRPPELIAHLSDADPARRARQPRLFSAGWLAPQHYVRAAVSKSRCLAKLIELTGSAVTRVKASAAPLSLAKRRQETTMLESAGSVSAKTSVEGPVVEPNRTVPPVERPISAGELRKVDAARAGGSRSAGGARCAGSTCCSRVALRALRACLTPRSPSAPDASFHDQRATFRGWHYSNRSGFRGHSRTPAQATRCSATRDEAIRGGVRSAKVEQTRQWTVVPRTRRAERLPRRPKKLRRRRGRRSRY
jgi:hypothetical protein